MDFDSTLETIALGIEIVGVSVLVGGMAIAGVRALLPAAAACRVQTLRRGLGVTILLGLEILVIGDIIRSVAIEPTLRGVAVLGIIVLIRTFLSFSIETEIEGVLPWRQRRARRE